MSLTLKSKGSKVKVLMVGASPDDARYIRELFTQINNISLSLEWVNRFDGALGRIAGGGIDLILLDVSLPDAEGVSAFISARAKAPDIPIVVITGVADETLAIEAVQSGAQDYLIRGLIDTRLLERAISHAIERQKFLVELERNRRQEITAKEQFLSQISREIQSPLTQLNQFITALMGGGINPEERAYLELALQNVNRLKSVMGGIMESTSDVSGAIEGVPQCVCLGDIIADALGGLHPSADAGRLRLSSCAPDELPACYCDPKAVKQILFNLIEAQSAASAEGVDVAIRAEIQGSEPDYICVSVMKTPPSDPSSSERADTRQTSGDLGFSMETCRELVSKQGGRIWFEGGDSCGAAFYFTLPVFSIARLLTPLITKNSRLWDSIALITVGLGTSNRQLLNGALSEAAQMEARNILCYCIRSEDIILPNLSGGGEEASYHIVAQADKGGAQSLVGRLQAQLEQSDVLRIAGVSARVAFSVIDVPESVRNKPLFQGSKQVAKRIEALIKHQSQRKRALA
ncbi:MAG: response regulator [Deltaproteobacteria bacterium]